MDNSKIVYNWAIHAAEPFQGVSRQDASERLSCAIEMALRAGSAVLGDLKNIEFAYRWDGSNNISVEMDRGNFTSDMLIISGK